MGSLVAKQRHKAKQTTQCLKCLAPVGKRCANLAKVPGWYRGMSKSLENRHIHPERLERYLHLESLKASWTPRVCKLVIARKARGNILPGDCVQVTTGFSYEKDGPRTGYFRSERLVGFGPGHTGDPVFGSLVGQGTWPKGREFTPTEQEK